MSLYAFYLGQIISVLGQVDHDGQHGNAAQGAVKHSRAGTPRKLNVVLLS
jgi:hypothetical protein